MARTAAEIDQDQRTMSMVMAMLKTDPRADKWINDCCRGNYFWADHEEHHIYGRTHRLSDSRCNLIAVHNVTHRYCHGLGGCKQAVEVCCLAVQLRLQKEHDEKVAAGKAKSLAEHKRFWNPELLAKIAFRDSLEGRIEAEILPVVLGTPLEAVAEELLTIVRAGQ